MKLTNMLSSTRRKITTNNSSRYITIAETDADYITTGMKVEGKWRSAFSPGILLEIDYSKKRVKILFDDGKTSPWIPFTKARLLEEDLLAVKCATDGDNIGGTDGDGDMGGTVGGMGATDSDGGMGATDSDGGMGGTDSDGGMGATDGDGGMGATDSEGGMGGTDGDGGMGATDGDGGMGATDGEGGMGATDGDGGMGATDGDGGMGATDHDGIDGCSGNGRSGGYMTSSQNSNSYQVGPSPTKRGRVDTSEVLRQIRTADKGHEDDYDEELPAQGLLSYSASGQEVLGAKDPFYFHPMIDSNFGLDLSPTSFDMYLRGNENSGLEDKTGMISKKHWDGKRLKIKNYHPIPRQANPGQTSKLAVIDDCKLGDSDSDCVEVVTPQTNTAGSVIKKLLYGNRRPEQSPSRKEMSDEVTEEKTMSNSSSPPAAPPTAALHPLTLTHILPPPYITKKYRMLLMTLDEKNFFERTKKVVGNRYLNYFSYDSDGDTITFRWGDTEGVAIFLMSGITELALHPGENYPSATTNKKRNSRKNEELGKVEKMNMSKEAIFTKVDYLRYSKNNEIVKQLKSDRSSIMHITGVFDAGTCILNRSVIVCPLCTINQGLKPKHAGGLQSLITHMRHVHKENPLATKLIKNYYNREGDMQELNNYEKFVFKDLSDDKRYCNLSIVEDLLRNDRSSLNKLKNRAASDYFTSTNN